MRIVLAALVFAACSHPPPPPAAKPQTSQRLVRTPVSATPTCADMGPLLRGAMDDEEKEGPKKEALIVAACERDQWPAEMLACAASATEPTVQDCLKKLPEDKLASYDKAIEKYGRVQSGSEHDPPPSDELASCDDTLDASSLEGWPPAVDDGDRALTSKLRKTPLRKLCDDQHWSVAVRQCIASTPTSGIDACLDLVGDARRDEVTRAIKEADELRQKIIKAREKPATVTCEKAVAVHYAAAKWVGKEPELKGAARTKAIAASKKAMLQTCSASWSIEARACVVAVDSDQCVPLGALGAAWGYPASVAGSPFPPTGIVECDEYGAAVVALSACEQLPEQTRKAMLDAFEQASAAWKNLPRSAVSDARAACTAARDATRQALGSCT